MDQIAKLRGILAESHRAVFFGGAGMLITANEDSIMKMRK